MNETLAENKVSVHPDGYLEVTLVGDQNGETIERSGMECVELIEQLRYEHKPLLGLIDFTLEKGFSTQANKATMEAMGKVEYDRVALFGTSPVLAEVSGLIIKALGKDHNTKVFRTREEALAWLMMRDPLAG